MREGGRKEEDKKQGKRQKKVVTKHKVKMNENNNNIKYETLIILTLLHVYRGVSAQYLCSPNPQPARARLHPGPPPHYFFCFLCIVNVTYYKWFCFAV